MPAGGRTCLTRAWRSCSACGMARPLASQARITQSPRPPSPQLRSSSHAFQSGLAALGPTERHSEEPRASRDSSPSGWTCRNGHQPKSPTSSSESTTTAEQLTTSTSRSAVPLRLDAHLALPMQMPEQHGSWPGPRRANRLRSCVARSAQDRDNNYRTRHPDGGDQASPSSTNSPVGTAMRAIRLV